jgi:imidazole glycerol-phosphate synthase subunit HisH
MNISIIDYGMGNLRSVSNALETFGCTVRIIDQPEELSAADKIVLPGVGAFGDGIKNLHQRGWVPVLQEQVIQRGKPFIGLCVGMQVLATTGTEYGTHNGLGWIPGVVKRLESDEPRIRVPHIGWNDVRIINGAGMYGGMRESGAFYFVHSYILYPDDPSVINGISDHGADFAASIQKNNIWATQYHPEKSQKDGLKVLQNFVNWKGD